MRFYVRDLLWLMLVTGMALGWWLSCRHLQARSERRSEYIGRLKDELRVEIGWRNAMIQFLRDNDFGSYSLMSFAGELPPELENEP